MNNEGTIRVHKGRAYASRPLEHGELPCENCAAVDGLKHDWDLCEALRPCGRVNTPDGKGRVWDDISVQFPNYSDEEGLLEIMARRQVTCTALIFRPKRWLMWPDDADAEYILCDRCRKELQALWDEDEVDYNIEPMPEYFECAGCGDGITSEIIHNFRFMLEEVCS